MSFDKLPQELTDYILDFVQDSQLTLYSCLQVSRSLAEASRYHLFRTVEVHGKKKLGEEDSLTKFLQLTKSPRTARHICRLSIWTFPFPSELRNADAFVSMPLRDLQSLISQLPSLQFLELKYVRITDEGDEQKCYPATSSVATPFSHRLQFLDMEAVAMDNINSTLPDLLSLLQPSKLRASVVFPTKPSTMKATRSLRYRPPPIPSAISSIELLWASDECLRALSLALSDDYLRTLTIEGPYESERSLSLVGKLLDHCASSLKELRLSEYLFNGSTQWNTLPLERLQLKSVTIPIALDINPSDFLHTWQAVASLLNSLPKTITRIKFLVELSDVPECLPRPLLPPTILDPCFDRFPSLETVAFGWMIYQYPTRPKRSEELMDMVRRLFPHLQRRGILQHEPESSPRHWLWYKW